MKTEIIFDGKLLEQRLLALKNLKNLIKDVNMESEIREVEKLLADKERFIKEADNCHIYADICIDGKYNPFVITGNFGLGVVGDTSAPLYRVRNRRIHVIKTAQDIRGLKNSILSCYKQYDDLVIEHQTEPTIRNIIGNDYEMDFTLFQGSDLWLQLKYARDTEAEKKNLDKSLCFTQRDAFEFVRLFPTTYDTTSPISKYMQKVILTSWKYYLKRRCD